MYRAVIYKSIFRKAPDLAIQEEFVCDIYDMDCEGKRIESSSGSSFEELIEGCTKDPRIRYNTLLDSVETINCVANLKRGQGHFRDEIHIPLEISQLVEFNNLYVEKKKR